jgi:hypothetical protein
VGAWVEDIAIDSHHGMHTALDHQDTILKDIADVATDLLFTHVVKVCDRVVVTIVGVIVLPIGEEGVSCWFLVFLITVRSVRV